MEAPVDGQPDQLGYVGFAEPERPVVAPARGWPLLGRPRIADPQEAVNRGVVRCGACFHARVSTVTSAAIIARVETPEGGHWQPWVIAAPASAPGSHTAQLLHASRRPMP